MSTSHFLWLDTGSTLRPMILQLRFAKSDCKPAIYPSSVVHTGVKSLGWENRMAQPSPIHSWNLMGPCVVSATKSGAVSLRRSDIMHSLHKYVDFPINPLRVSLGVADSLCQADSPFPQQNR